MKMKQLWGKLYGPVLMLGLVIFLLPAYEDPAYAEYGCAASHSHSESGNEIQIESAIPAEKVELIYFHLPRRCEACTFAEERIEYIVYTFFQQEMDEGKLIFQIVNVRDEAYADLAKRYGAIGSQLFINPIRNGQDNIRYVEEIWYWGCIDDEEVFDKTVRSVIEKALYGEERM